MKVNKEFLEAELKMGVSFDNPEFMSLCEATAKQIDLPVNTVLDFGAGTGCYAYSFDKLGYDVSAYEIWEAHREYMTEKMPHIKQVDYPFTTDLLLSIEVFEHMTDEEIDQLFNQVTPQWVLFSSTSIRTEGDLEWGHINVKEQEEWIKLFESKGYTFVKDLTYPTEWAKLFKYGKA